MNYNIIKNYIDYIQKEYLNFFKIILKNNFKKDLCISFINKYIDVRYYDETNYSNEKDFIKRLNKELVDLYEDMVSKENSEDLKNIVALFGYIVYFDDVCITLNDMELINSLVSDDIIKINDKDSLKNELKNWYINFKKTREKFEDSILTKDFNLSEKKLGRKLYYLVLEHNIKISNLYSEYAIDKAYNTGTVAEDKLFVTYIMASFIVLNNALNLDFSNKYMVPMVNTLFSKEKKFLRLINILNNSLSKKNILIRLKYCDYKDNKDKIDKLINEGYSFAIELEDEYDGNINELILFPYVLVNKDSNASDLLEREKPHLNSKVVKL